MHKDTDDLIADYLSNTMDPAARLDFEQRMAADPELASRVELESTLAEALGASPEHNFRANLRSIANQYDTPESLVAAPMNTPKSKVSLQWIIVCFLAIGGAAGLYLLWPKGTPASPQPMKPSGESRAVLPEPPAENLPKIDSTQPQHTSHPSRPIAANFHPIPTLETYIGSQVRGGDFRLIVEVPRSGITLPANKTDFQLSGKTEGAIPAGQAFHALLFSNDLHAFEAMRPIANLQLVLRDDARFNLEKKLHLKPGLYYVVIEEVQSGSWLFVDKFLVK